MEQPIDELGSRQRGGEATPGNGELEESGAFPVRHIVEEVEYQTAVRRAKDVVVRIEDIPSAALGLNHLEQVIAANSEARELLGLGEHGWERQPVQAVLNFTCNLSKDFFDNESTLHARHRIELWDEHGKARPATLLVRRVPGGQLRYLCLLSAEDGADTAGAPASDQLAAMGQMIAGFAHEVRNPLAALKSIIEDLAAEPAVAEPWGKDLSRLNGLVGRIERLVRSSLRLVQPERPHRKEQDARALLASALDLLESRLRTGKGTISVSCATDRPMAIVDESQIVQVLIIVLENALEAAGSADRVRVRLREEQPSGAAGDRLVIIDIEDDGPGIPPELLSQIFNPFFTRKPRGTGLGLSIALKLLRENQGRIRVQSTLGAGSVFSIELPGTG